MRRMTGVVASIDVPLDLILQTVTIISAIHIATSISVPSLFTLILQILAIVGIISLVSIDVPPRFDFANPVSATAVLWQYYGSAVLCQCYGPTCYSATTVLRQC